MYITRMVNDKKIPLAIVIGLGIGWKGYLGTNRHCKIDIFLRTLGSLFSYGFYIMNYYVK